MAGVPTQSVPEAEESDFVSEWQPLSVRELGATPRTLDELPSHGLAHALVDWLTSLRWASGRTTLVGRPPAMRDGVPWQRVALRLNLPPLLNNAQEADWRATVLNHARRPERVLEVVDATLHLEPRTGNHAQSLSERLSDAGSAWCVRQDRSGLTRRVSPAVSAAYEMAASTSDNARARLEKAWTAAYGLHPDPGAAYRHAVAAVEAAAIPLFLPADAQASLGKVRAHLDQGRAKYELVVSDRTGSPASIDSVVEMVSTLWHGQRDRHEGGSSSAPITQEAAEAAVHVAVLLVQWLATGAIRPVTHP